MTRILIDDFMFPAPGGMAWAKRWKQSDAQASPPAEPLVMLHDSLGCVDLWRDFPANLAIATGRDVIAYDRVGFGRSDPHPNQIDAGFVDAEATGTLASLIDHLKLDRFVLFGHSVGGGMATTAAARFGPSCQALITVAAQAFVEDRTRNGILDAKQAFTEPGQLERLEKYHGDKAKWVLSAWIDTWLSDAFSDWRLDTVLPNVTCPILVIHGDGDEYGSAAHPDRLAALSTGPATKIIIKDCGHVPHREQPEKLVAAVQAFLAQD